MTVATFFERN